MKAINRIVKNVRKAMKKGFTLIELAIVGLFLGLLAVFAISAFSGAATDNTRAVSLFEASTKVADNWALLTQQCGTTRNISSLSLANSAATATTTAGKNLSMLLGNIGVDATYQTCYEAAGIRPLTGLASGAQGSEKISGYEMAVQTIGSDRYLAVTYKAVPENVFAAAAMKYAGLSTVNSSTADVDAIAAGGTVGFGYVKNGSGPNRDVTFVRPL